MDKSVLENSTLDMRALFTDEGFAAGVRSVLERCAHLAEANRAAVYLFAAPWKLYKFTEWMANPILSEDIYLKNLYLKWFPWLESVIEQGAPWGVLSRKDLGQDRDRDRSFFESAGFEQLLIYPFRVDGERFGLVWIELAGDRTPDEETLRRVSEESGILRTAFKHRWMERELRHLREELRETALVKNSFLSNISHEIRTPLNAIIGFSHLLNSELTEPQQRRYAEAIQSSGHSLLKLVNDILTLSRLESRGEKINLKKTDLESLLREMEQIFMVRIKEKDIRFITELDRELPSRLMLDEEKIRQILINLIGNALKFTQNGSVKVSVGIMQGSLKNGKCDLVIAVEDTGIGIEDEDLRKIFEPFVQQSDSNLKRFEGAGLGLTLCKKLTDLLGGQIQVKSTPGIGSIFSLFFPAITVPGMRTGETGLETVEDIDGLVFENRTVLVADDHANNLTLLEVILKRSGINVLTAVNGQEAVEMATRLKPDLILMDLKMPVMDGMEAAAEIRSNPDIRGIPIIVLTAYPDILQDSNRGVFNGFLIKPVSIPQVIRELTRFFSFSYQNRDGSSVQERSVDSGFVLNLEPAQKDRMARELLPLLEGTRSALVMKDVYQIAERVRLEAQTSESGELMALAEELLRFVHDFDIDKLDKWLGEFYHYLKDS